MVNKLEIYIFLDRNTINIRFKLFVVNLLYGPTFNISTGYLTWTI
jgi:hypothetical protein